MRSCWGRLGWHAAETAGCLAYAILVGVLLMLLFHSDY